MNLQDFPDAIAESQRHLSLLKQTADEMQEVVDRMMQEIDYQVAFDPDLKNDAQRKARRIELMTSAQYVGALNTVKEAKQRCTLATIETDRLINLFAVAKIQAREAIAQMSAVV